ncbi:MAG: thioesterase family protein [Candidatus Nanopelagicales bacterium]
MGHLEDVLTLREQGGEWSAEVPAGWAQGRTTFGGLVAAFLARAAEAACDRPIRSMDIYFLEPVIPGPVTLKVESTRTGKHLTHLEVGMYAQAKRVATARLIHADATTGRLDVVPAAPAQEKSFDEAIEMPFIDGVMPEFLQNLELRLGEGDPPMTGSSRAVAGGFVRNRGPARGVAALLTHGDAWPPPQLAMVDHLVPASSVRWHVAFHADVTEADGEQWSWLRSEATWRSGPLSTVVGMLVRDGAPVAYLEQTIVMYA